MGTLFLYLILLVSGVTSHSLAKMLYDRLMRKSGYNRHIRPVASEETQVLVNIGLTLSQIIDVVSELYINISPGYYSLYVS